MTILEAINKAIVVLLLIFDTVIGARIVKILIDTQLDPDQDTAKKIRNRIIVIVVVNILVGTIMKMKTFYQ